VTDALLNADPRLLIGIALALSVTLMALVGGVVYALGEPRRQVHRRMEGMGLHRAGLDVGEGQDRNRRGSVGGDPQSRQRRIQEKLKELERSKEKKARRRNRIRLMLMRAGLRVDHRLYLLVTILLGFGAAVAVMLFSMPLLVAAAVGVTAAFGLPRLVLGFMAKRREKKFTREFSSALDVLVRGVQAGLPASECIAIVAREVPDPVGEEFRMMVEGQRLGMGLSEVMARGLERMPTPEYKFFSIVLQIQQQTGGNLAETLDNLSNVIRDRKQMRDKVKALSSEAKASAIIIGSLPFAVVAIISVTSPNYMAPLFYTEAGHIIIGGGLMYMMIGIGIMAKMINFKM